MAQINQAALEALIEKGQFTATEASEVVRAVSGEGIYGPDLITRLKMRKGYILTTEIKGYRDRIYHFQKAGAMERVEKGAR